MEEVAARTPGGAPGDTSNEKPAGWSQAFAALKHRNYRLFWGGQCISLIGTWMQNVAQAWLVLELTKSAFWLGVVSAVQFTPMLLFSLYAGTLVDRLPKRRVLIVTQTVMMILAFILAVDVWLKTAAVWHIIILAGLLGVATTFDMPTRQAFMVELVGRNDLTNAIVLNSSIFNGARIIGPSVAGLVIGKLGIALCFLLNSISFIPVIGGLSLIRLKSGLESAPRREQGGILGEIKTGLSFAVGKPEIFAPLILLAVVNLFTMNFNVLIPLYVKSVFHGQAQTFGFLMSANGVGALIGSVILALRSSAGPKARTLVSAAVGICIFEILLLPARRFALAYLLLSLVGVSTITFTTNANTLVQLHTPQQLKGRVMSIYTLLFAGLSPLGSLMSGSAASAFGSPVTLALGGGIALVCVVLVKLRFRYR